MTPTTEVNTTCDTCGAPATNWARDEILVKRGDDKNPDEYKVGDLKAGCNKHSVVAVAEDKLPEDEDSES